MNAGLPALILSILLPATAPAGDWASFRGPDASGVSRSDFVFPVPFGDQDVEWRAGLPGRGASSPVVYGGKVYLTCEAAEDSKRLVVCLSLADGREVWRVEDSFAPYGKHSFNSFASSTPAADEHGVYLAWSSGDRMIAVALSHDGRKRWQTDLGPYHEEHGSGASPVLAGGRLIVGKDNVGAESFLAGLDPADGSILWKVPRSSSRTPFSSPVPVRHSDGRECVVVAGNPVALTCVSAADGAVVWEVNYPDHDPALRPVASPVRAGETLFAAVGQGGAGKSGIAVKAGGNVPAIAWEGRKSLPYVPTPLALGGRLYVAGDGGVLTCVDPADGRELWSERVFRDKVYSSPVSSGGRIYVLSRSGRLAAVSVTDGFRLLGETSLGEATDATPAISGNRLILRTNTRVICLRGSAAVP